ncbi:hypothetical protein OH76DRAFT_896048 [Lentinus brumalis]|uniref:Uncharacterized protein n=1 Tax=Lentinus brumalis TaxID=2498619 RepID=A0A371D0L4_9APHY|nr:hypothetical protein OH76DRAFT_896048 [Polyporus brumalis]
MLSRQGRRGTGLSDMICKVEGSDTEPAPGVTVSEAWHTGREVCRCYKISAPAILLRKTWTITVSKRAPTVEHLRAVRTAGHHRDLLTTFGAAKTDMASTASCMVLRLTGRSWSLLFPPRCLHLCLPTRTRRHTLHFLLWHKTRSTKTDIGSELRGAPYRSMNHDAVKGHAHTVRA